MSIMKRKTIIKWSLVFFIIQWLIVISVFGQQKYSWDKELVRKVTINNKTIINKLVLELFIPESNVEYLEIFDVDANGATEGDLLRVHPSRNVYSLMMLSKECREILGSIQLPANTEEMGYTININDPSTPQQRILFILASTIKALYSQDKPLKLYFEQNDSGLYKFEFYGFNPVDLKDDKNFTLGKGQKEQIHDLLKALYKEFNEEFVSWQPTVIHVIKTERDTLVVPEKISKK